MASLSTRVGCALCAHQTRPITPLVRAERTPYLWVSPLTPSKQAIPALILLDGLIGHDGPGAADDQGGAGGEGGEGDEGGEGFQKGVRHGVSCCCGLDQGCAMGGAALGGPDRSGPWQLRDRFPPARRCWSRRRPHLECRGQRP